MALLPDSHYRALVDDQLKRTGLQEPPVSVDDVAERLGLRRVSLSLPPWFSGAIIVEDGFPVLLLNATLSPEKRRDTLAHLLSHVIVGLDDPAAPYPRDREPVHRVAEMMSAEFVMPSYMVMEQASKWFNDHRYLARLFGVSESAMMAKMREMGLIKGGGILWDY